MAEDKYMILKFRQNGPTTKMRGLNNLTLDEAKRYCSRPDTHGKGWFCGFTKAGRK
jgi:hypothetical protein